MSDDIDVRRRRALYRAAHRGTKEMDWYLGRFGAAKIMGMTDPDLATFEELLALPDPELERWILNPAEAAASPFAALIAEVREFAGLDTASAKA